MLSAPIKWVAIAGFVILCTLAGADTAMANDCGETAGPGGTNAPCSCGDTVITDTRLDSGDPVTENICSGNGLTVAPGILLRGGLQRFDIDGNGVIDALTDGILTLRSLFLFEGDALIAGNVVAADCTRCTVEEIEAFLETLLTDVDGNGMPDALTDGILVLRLLFGFTGDALTAGDVLPADCIRCDEEALRNFVLPTGIARITGSELDNIGVGITAKAGAIVREIRVTGFMTGVSCAGNTRIERMEILANIGNGITCDGANGLRSVKNRVFNNGLNGINVAGAGNILEENQVIENGNHGIAIVGADNLIKKNEVGQVGQGNTNDGINVSGDRNRIEENEVIDNGNHGIAIVGDSNIVTKNDSADQQGQGNGTDGVNVNGSDNRIEENNVHDNGGDGIEVTGGTIDAPNIIKKNEAGDSGKGNLRKGIFVTGNDMGNGFLPPVEVDENVAIGNGGEGIDTSQAMGGHDFANNKAEDNAAGQINCRSETNGDPPAQRDLDAGANFAAGLLCTIGAPMNTDCPCP